MLFRSAVWDKFGKKSIPIIALLVFLGKILRVDYGWYGVLSVFLLYVFRERKILRIFAFAMLNLIYYQNRLFLENSLPYLISYICTTIPVIFLLFYNGKLGRKTKYLYYLFYPLHMFLFYMINLGIR